MGIDIRTNVIVVGAGASQEFGLPTGDGLKHVLQQSLDFNIDGFGQISGRSGDLELRHAIELHSRKLGLPSRDFQVISKVMSKNMPLAPSIDNYLDTHKKNNHAVAVGKLAIANALLKAERRSSLFIKEGNANNRVAFDRNTETWAAVFFKIIAAKRNFDSFLAAIQQITFISFNYDRCIKQFFVNAATSYFGLSDPDATHLLQEIRVVHPYGNMGELGVSFGRTTGFGEEVRGASIVSAAERIRTFTEGVADKELLDSIRKPLSEAEVIIFLGFSFIDINMEIINPPSANADRVLATSKGRSTDTIKRLSVELGKKFAHKGSNAGSVEMFDGKCFELFYEYDHYLSSAQGH